MQYLIFFQIQVVIILLQIEYRVFTIGQSSTNIKTVSCIE